MTIFKKVRAGARCGTALRSLALIGAALGAASIPAIPAFAQDYTTGAIVGSVQSETGEDVGSGSVTVQSNAQGFTRTTAIGPGGSFRVSALPVGTYTVTVSAPGYQSVSDPTIEVSAGGSNSFVFTLAPSVEGEEIVVIGTAIRANDFAATQTGIELDVQELVQTVPVARDDTALILLAPGTVQGDNGFPNLASIGGATVGENSYYVNGLNITNFRNFVGGGQVPFEFYRTIDVKTGGFQAEFGRALGGFTSAVTKSGSNDLKAGAVLVFNPDELREDAPNTYAAYNQGDYAQSLNANLYVSGPIIEDRLFVYGLYNPRYTESRYSSFTGLNTTVEKSDTPFLGAKVDAIITDGHRLEFTYFRDKREFTYDYSDFDPETLESGPVYGRLSTVTGGDNFIGTYTGTLTDWLSLSASYGENHGDYSQVASPELPYITTRLALNSAGQAVNGTQRRASGTVLARMERINLRKVYRADADIEAYFLGDHHLRIGYDREDLTAVENVTRNGGYNYDFRSAFVLRGFYSNVGTFEARNEAFYLQDAWSLAGDRLNLQLGLRADRFRAKTLTGETYYDSKYQIAPRLGVSFDVFGDRRTKLNAFFGRYYLPVAANTSVRLTGSELFYTQRLSYPTGVVPRDFGPDGLPVALEFDEQGRPILGNSLAGDTISCPANSPNAGERCFNIISDGTVPAPDRLISEGLKPSYNDEFILGLTHRFGEWTAGINYIRRRLGETLEDQAIDAAMIRYCQANNISGCEQVWTGSTQFVLSNPGSDITVVPHTTIPELAGKPLTFTAEELGHSRAERNYDSVQLTLAKPFDGIWSLNSSYTWTNLRGNFEGAAKSDNNQREAGFTNDFDQPGYMEGAYGPLANERTHAFKLFGAFKPTDWLLLGANLVVASPRKFSCIGNYKDPNDFAADYGAASYYCSHVSQTGLPLLVTDPSDPAYDGITTAPGLVTRGSSFKSEWLKTLDLGVQFDIGALPGSAFRIDVFNVFNWQDKLDFNEYGDIPFGGASPDYGKVLAYTAPRAVRFTLTMRFGEEER